MLNRIIIISFFTVISSLLLGQTKDFEKEFRNYLILADDYFKYGNYIEALPFYKELYEMDSSNFEVNYKYGICLFKTKRNKKDFLKYFEYTKNEYTDGYCYLGQIHHLKMNFNTALENFHYYKNHMDVNSEFDFEEVDHLIQKSITAKGMTQNPVDADIENIGGPINSAASEYVPLINADESIMYFTARKRGSTGGLVDPNNEFFEDIYFSKKADSMWTKPQNLRGPVNTNTHDACVALSSDGQKMLIYRTNKMMTGGDIYETELVKDKWTEPVKLTSEVNSGIGAETSAIYSPDQNTIYFSSNRPGGYGGKDIYRIKKMPDNTWSKALNLGPSINTKYDEDAPFIHPDGITMYFSSKGHKNMGGYDIFKSVKQDKNWTAPENLGYPINTVGDDIYFVLSANGKHGYYSSTKKGGLGNADIYVINMPSDDNNYVILKGTVITNEPIYKKLKAVITVINYETKELQGIYRTNERNGKYMMVLLPRKHYKMIVESDGYHNLIDDIDLREKLRVEDLFKNITMYQQKYKSFNTIDDD